MECIPRPLAPSSSSQRENSSSSTQRRIRVTSTSADKLPDAAREDRLRIALYYPWVYLTSGAERAILELTGRSRHQWTIFTSHFDSSRTFPGFSQRRVVTVRPVSVERSVEAVARGAWTIINTRLPTRDFDALFVVCEGLGDLIVFRNRGLPTFCLCLTPLRLAFDEHYRACSLAHRSAFGRLVIALGAGAFRRLDRWAWRRYARVFCISEESRRRAVEGNLARSEDLRVVRLGLGFEPSLRSRRFERYFLIPGRIMWTKNVELGIRAFLEFRESRLEFEDFRLVIAGIVDEKSKPYIAKLRALVGDSEGIEFIVHPSDESLADLYRRCYGVVFTAFNEDWGMVPLESMAFGKPVIATNRGGPRETVTHQENGFLEEPQPTAFARRMVELAQDLDLAERLGNAGYRYAQRYSWDDFAKQIDREIEDGIG